MHVLVVTKPTNFELHGERVRSNVQKGFLPPSNLHRLEEAHSQHYTSLRLVKEQLDKHGVDWTLISRQSAWPDKQDFDVHLTVGGDGTLLFASHQLPAGARLVGIRSSDASVGFTSAGGVDHIEQLIADIAADRVVYRQVSRAIVKVFRVRTGEVATTVPVLNDILFANRSPAATTRYCLTLGNVNETHKSSGVWISTPVGSTAGILAAGGKEQHIEDRNFQFRVRELYVPPGVSYDLVGGTYNPDENQLMLENRCEAALIALDGQHGEFLLEFGDKVIIERGPNLFLASPELAFG